MKFDFLSESDQAYFIHKASTLVEALPYIREHSGDTIVIKYGGHAMGDKKLSESFSRDIGLLKEVGVSPIIIHGGGPQIGERLKSKNISTQFVEGLRVTDKETIKVVEEVLSKDINSEIVESISASGGKAIGVSGNDNLVTATKLNVEIKDSDSNIEKIVDIGFVGQPKKLNKDMLTNFIKNGQIPVISPLGKDENNFTYNINADTVAGSIASALNATRLLMLTDVDGVLDEKGKLINEMKASQAQKLIKEDIIKGGMIPKVETCLKSVRKGVDGAVIIDGRVSHSILLELFTSKGAGTIIRT